MKWKDLPGKILFVLKGDPWKKKVSLLLLDVVASTGPFGSVAATLRPLRTSPGPRGASGNGEEQGPRRAQRATLTSRPRLPPVKLLLMRALLGETDGIPRLFPPGFPHFQGRVSHASHRSSGTGALAEGGRRGLETSAHSPASPPLLPGSQAAAEGPEQQRARPTRDACCLAP